MGDEAMELMDARPRLSVLIATCRPDGIERVVAMDLPEVAGVHYWVSWQMHENLPVPESLASRKDVTVLRADSIGSSNNRNNLLEQASGEIFLIADDDLRYTPDQLSSIIKTFDDNPEVDYASFMYTGADAKSYPPVSCSLRPIPKYFSQTCFEVAIRCNEETAKLRFNTYFGIAAPTLCAAEDEIFLLQAVRSGLNCRFFPIVITHHAGLTTGKRRITDYGVLKASGAVIFIQYPFTAVLRVPLKAWRLSKSGQAPFCKSLWYLCKGVWHLWTNRDVRHSVKFKCQV